MIRKHISQPWFDLIKSGKKKYEGRLNDGFWKEVQTGQKITLYNNDSGVEKTLIIIVDTKLIFVSFFDGISTVGLNSVLPSEVENTVEQSVENVYRKYYSVDDEKKYGVVMIGFSIE